MNGMVDAPSRRTVLRTGVVTVGSALGGCLLNNPQVGGGHLFVENMLPTEYRMSLTVIEGTDGEGDQVVDGWFRIPPDHALQFQNVIEAGTTYTITAHRPNVEAMDRVTVTVRPCGGNEDAVRDVSVRVREDGTGIIPWACDEEYTRRELEYVNATEYAIDEPQATERPATTDE